MIVWDKDGGIGISKNRIFGKINRIFSPFLRFLVSFSVFLLKKSTRVRKWISKIIND
jgi:hypothetical protein